MTTTKITKSASQDLKRDPLAIFSVAGVGVAVLLGAALLLSSDFQAFFANGSQALYDAALWMAEMCRFD